MKPWKPCEHCYLGDKYCENAERELPCVLVQEYLKSGYEIKRLQNLLEVSEKEHYKTLQQLSIATKALKRYEDKQNWDIRGVSFMKYNKGFTVARQALKEIEEVK